MLNISIVKYTKFNERCKIKICCCCYCCTDDDDDGYNNDDEDYDEIDNNITISLTRVVFR